MITLWTQAIQIENSENYLFIFKWILEFEFCVIVANVVALRKVTFIHGLILWVGGLGRRTQEVYELGGVEAGGAEGANGRWGGEQGSRWLWEGAKRASLWWERGMRGAVGMRREGNSSKKFFLTYFIFFFKYNVNILYFLKVKYFKLIVMNVDC